MDTSKILDITIDGNRVTMHCKLCDAHCEVFDNVLRPELSPTMRQIGIELTAERIARQVTESHDIAQGMIDELMGTIGNDSDDKPDIPNGQYPYDMLH